MKSITLAVIFAIALTGMAHGAESYSLTSYYPAPYGKYESVETNILICNNDTTFAGNVSVGTTSNGTVTAQNLIVNNQAVLLGDTFLDNPTGDPLLQFQRASGSVFQIGYQTASNKLDLRTSAALTAQVFTITRMGRVGIGINGNWTPTTSLEVAGDSYITLATTIDGATSINNTTTLNGTTSIVDSDLSVLRTAAGSNAQIIFSNNGSSSAIGNNNSSEFRISPITNSIANATAIMTSSGLGVKIAPGAYALNVSGTAYLSGDTTFSSAITVTNNIGTNNGLLRIKNVTLSQGTAIAGGTPVDTLVSSHIIAAPEFLHSSDERLKENIAPITGALAKVKALQGVSFNFKNKPGRKIGLVAQNVEKVVPEVVATGSDGMKSVEYDSLVGLIVEAIKEQQLEIEQIRSHLQHRPPKQIQ